MEEANTESKSHKLEQSIINALRKSEEALDELRVVLDAVGPNTIIDATHGSGNAIYQLFRYCMEWGDVPPRSRDEVLTILIEGGVGADQPCQDSFTEEKVQSLWDWIEKVAHHNEEEGVKEFVEQWWTEGRIKALLDNGIDYCPAQDREDFIGQAIRDHPRWKRRKLGIIAEQGGQGEVRFSKLGVRM